MKYRYSEVPLTVNSRVLRAKETGDNARREWYGTQTVNRFWERAAKWEARYRNIRAANRRMRRQLGLSFRNA